MTIPAEQREATTEWLLDRVPGKSAVAIGEAMARLIRSGELPQGAQLPTIREFAKATSTSVGTILSAWNSLRADGLIVTNRRGGTTVSGAPAPRPQREHPQREAFGLGLDLAQSAPDIALQPELQEALLAALQVKNLNVFGREPAIDELLEVVAPTWPFPAGAWTTAGGGTEALLLGIAAAAPPGSWVAVDEPVGPGVLDTLRDLELHAVGVSSDESGPTVESLRAALAHGPAAFVFQPGAPFAVSHVVTPRRIAELAQVLREHEDPVWVVEDDSLGPLSAVEPGSIGAYLPDRVLRIRSYCKAYGIDVRTSVLGGAKALVERSMELRSHGVGSNSRILQGALAHLIRSDQAAAAVETARERYAVRRASLIDALRSRDVRVSSGDDSLVVWVEVPDETEALVALARNGIAVGQGSRSFVTPPQRPLLRLSATLVPEEPAELERLAQIVAGAAHGSFREYFD